MTVFATSPSRQVTDLSHRATRPVVLLGLLVAVVMAVVAPVLAIDWAQHVPFPGVLVGANFLVTDSTGADWGPNAQLNQLDRIIAVDDARLIDQLSYETAMVEAGSRPEPLAKITFHRLVNSSNRSCGSLVTPEVYECQTTRLTRKLSAGELARLFGLPYVMGFAYLLVGVWIFRQRGQQRAGQALAFFTSLAAIDLMLLFEQTTTNVMTPVSFLALGLTSGSLLTMATVFPQSPRLIERLPLLRFLGYLPGLLIAVIAIVALYDRTNPWAYTAPVGWLLLLIGLSAGLYLLSLVYRRWRSDSPVVRQQSRIILWGSLLAFAPFVLWVGQALVDPATAFEPLVYLPTLVLFPVAIGVAMQRYNLLNIDRLITGGLTYAVMGGVAALIYLGLLAGLTLVLQSQVSLANNPVILVIFVLLVAIAFDQLRQRVNRAIDRVFFRNRLDTQTVLQNYSRNLTEVADLPRIIQTFRQQVTEIFHPERLYVYLLDTRTNLFCVQPDPAMPRLPLSAAQCVSDGPLARWIKSEPGPKYLPAHRTLPEGLWDDRERIETIGATLYVPLSGRDRINGWLALSHKQNDQPYSTDDLNFLSALANQTALALERAIVFDDLQRRNKELDALSRISQAVNFTLAADDVLELIYTQTSKVLDTRNFYIAMIDEKRGMMRFAFYIEGTERLYPDDEWPIETGLMGDIMRRGQPIVTDDYVAECERRGLKAGGRPGKAWMGVPLSGGDHPLGLMAVSDFRPEVTYTQEQLQIFAAIADQAASVLYKTRLYRQTEERARQLAVLNEVGSSITSTLDLRTVLETIVAKAIELLEAEAGSLLLVDDQHNELVFEVTFGPAAEDLRGQRLPFGKGIVGAVAQTRQPQIVNEAQTDVRWLRDVDRTTAFSTRSIVAVPMINKNRVIGVLELINKREADRFTEDDQQLLTAFATNAAVAVDNARLFTMTDQALASRLDELSMLQEIDRQLNTSLDIKRVLDLTLDWGLRMTNATAGSVGLVNREQNTIDLIAAREYTYQPASLPLDRGLAGAVAKSGQPILVNEVSQDARYVAGSAATLSQMSVPIKRESDVIGVMNLECNKLNAFGILQLDTANRLADHAATAVINAQLYQEVRRANDAKSEFVSIVSHELKTPMTSMKGYTDLLVKGMAGPVTDMQAQFLNVVRANVERMSTLVNDLLEVSRIETGRLKLDSKPIELDIVLDDTLRTTRAQIEERQQTLELNIPAGLPPVFADKSRVIQVLTNLISNAYKYTPNGGHITIEVTRESAAQPPHTLSGKVPATRPDANFEPNLAGYVWCAVKDSGVGINAEDQAKLFQKFFRSGDQAVRDQPGTGLGLAITKSLIELQKGAIWVDSNGVPGEGSTFAFSIPIAAESAAD